ncbi:hypothetical protein XELAEV_18035333mg [Xenopus laevis]|uniref:Uncharacterized protein n=1 Tax=Xenopus laevis TaxID=8355 RepID=A0A974CHQ7_XENLA|nr:hypothetical protein XELAEV_18035333mg [Xenopus laevis]
MAPLSNENGAQCKQWDVLFGSQSHCWVTDKVIPEALIGQSFGKEASVSWKMTQTGARFVPSDRTVSPSMPPFLLMLRSFRGWRGSSRWTRDFTLSRAPWSLRLGCLGCHQVLESTMDGHLGLPNISMDLGHPPPHPEFLAALLVEHRLHGSHHRVNEPRLCRLITQSLSFLLWWSPNCCSGSSTTYKKNQI